MEFEREEIPHASIGATRVDAAFENEVAGRPFSSFGSLALKRYASRNFNSNFHKMRVYKRWGLQYSRLEGSRIMCWNTSATFTPVGFALRGRASRKIVWTLGDAARLLMNDWPFDDGEEYVTAVRACLDALHDQIPPEAVRAALIRAADEERISHISLVS